MSWNLEGLSVEGKYMGDFPVKGKVFLSRVTYGGTVDHHVRLDEPILVYGAIRECVILENKYVERVFS